MQDEAEDPSDTHGMISGLTRALSATTAPSQPALKDDAPAGTIQNQTRGIFWSVLSFVFLHVASPIPRLQWAAPEEDAHQDKHLKVPCCVPGCLSHCFLLNSLPWLWNFSIILHPHYIRNQTRWIFLWFWWLTFQADILLKSINSIS